MNFHHRGARVIFCAIFTAVGFQSPAAAHTVTIPIWHTSFVYNSTTYPIEIVGGNPALGTTTLIASEIVPLRVVFSNDQVLDASAETAALLASPIYASAPFMSGTTQYGDAVLRAEFWQSAQSSSYHVLLAPPTVEPTYTLQVPAADGFTSSGLHGIVKGVVDFDWFVKSEEPLIVSQLGLPPTTLSVFLTRNIRLKNGRSTFGGEHFSFDVRRGDERDRYTTAWAGASAGDVDSMSHEIAEWLHDPFNENAVPPWVTPGTEGCNKHLEVGDPLVGTLFKVNGYVMQDVAYVDWFAREVPSAALNGNYDVLGRFTAPAADC
ncbi:MAG TPA: hypothetical protein VKT51_07315 [Candidatus Eremiobacteraceae bacterium]|nr:hypothetical protein [Candidatus Eremiobacteraceae bacterium]